MHPSIARDAMNKMPTALISVGGTGSSTGYRGSENQPRKAIIYIGFDRWLGIVHNAI